MVKRFIVAFALLCTAACEKHPGYRQSVSVSEEGAVWEVKLNKAFHSDQGVWVELEYANRAGPAFTVWPRNVLIRDDEGHSWIADGRMAMAPLLQPGNSQVVRAGFSDAVVGNGPLYLVPFSKLTHDGPVFLLKAKGDTPLPGNHENEHWDTAQ